MFDYGSGNLHSAGRALASAGADVTVTGDLAVLRRQDGLVVPGVGAFAACMAALRRSGGDDLIREWVAASRPLLGICVGHQVMLERGHEHGVITQGLGLLPGSVVRLPTRRLPHMGWNRVQAPQGSRLFAGVEHERFYFLHSYASLAAPVDAMVTTAEHEGAEFVAATETASLSTTQFHPEKSGAAGVALLQNWLALW